MGQSAVIPADYLSLVRSLRAYLNNLDNCHLILDRVYQLRDPAVMNDTKKVSGDVRATAAKLATILRHIEGSQQYKDTVKKYTAPSSNDLGE